MSHKVHDTLYYIKKVPMFKILKMKRNNVLAARIAALDKLKIEDKSNTLFQIMNENFVPTYTFVIYNRSHF